MSVELLEDTEHHRIEWDDDVGAPVFTWKMHVTGDEFRASLNRLHETIVERGTNKYLVDTQEIAAHDDADKRWLSETWIPRLVEDGVRYGAGVYPDSVVAEMDMEKIEAQVNQSAEDYTFKTFADLDEALRWLGRQ